MKLILKCYEKKEEINLYLIILIKIILLDIRFFKTYCLIISKITGWSAHIMEQHAANKLIRPLASYKGSKHRKVLELNYR